LDHPAETRGEGNRRDSADPTSLRQTNRAALAGLQADRHLPTLKKPGRPSRASVSLRDAALILEAYDKLKVNALTLEHVLRDIYRVELPHNKKHMILKEAGRALPQPSKQTRRKWVRYEREHSMSLWHMDWKQLSDGRWWIACMDDASRLIVSYGVF